MPSTPEPPTHISLKVKVPPGYLSTADNSSGSDSFVLGSAVPVTANVGQLRQQIQQLIPTHPAPEKQRLLYGGRALVDNEQRLGDAFNVKRDPTQTEYVVHLLVKGEQGGNDSGPAHRRAVSTPPTQTAGGQQQQQHQHPQVQFPQAQNGQRMPFQVPGAQLHQHFPQIIARNQQMRAGQGMQGVGGQQAQGQGQPPSNAPMDRNGSAGQTMPQPLQTGQHAERDSNNQQAGNNGLPLQAHQHPQFPGRPISGQGFHMQGVGPNGQHFQIHQQMMQFPMAGGGGGGGMPGQMPFGFPGMPPQVAGMIPGMGMPHPNLTPGPGLPQQQQQNGPSALDRARDNMAEMRRLLEETRNQNNTSEEQRSRIREIQQRAQTLNEYIDPLQLGNANGAANGPRPTPANPAAPTNRPAFPQLHQQGIPPLHNAPRRPMMSVPSHPYLHFAPPSNPNEVTAYLLSSPQGPQALLFSPQHGAYTGSVAQNARPQPTPTTTTTDQQPQQQPGQQQHPPQDPVAQAAHRAAQELQIQHAQLHAAQANEQAQAQAGQDGGPVQALLGHFWLLMRVLIFAYFFLGSNMGWQRPLALAAIGFGFWMVRAGAFGDGAAVRRWWEGVVGVEPQQARREGVEGAGAQGGVGGAMPTPQQVAQRLLNEQQQQQRGWLREQVRPVERAVALFVASLWPGVGEATVRARREMEERVREEEAERERLRAEEVEEERVRRIRAGELVPREGDMEEDKEGEGAKGEGEKGSGGEKRSGVGESSAVEGSEGVEGLRERRAGGEEGRAAAATRRLSA